MPFCQALTPTVFVVESSARTFSRKQALTEQSPWLCRFAPQATIVGFALAESTSNRTNGTPGSRTGNCKNF